MAEPVAWSQKKDMITVRDVDVPRRPRMQMLKVLSGNTAPYAQLTFDTTDGGWIMASSRRKHPLLCDNGFHATDLVNLQTWWQPRSPLLPPRRLWIVELGGRYEVNHSKIAAEYMRFREPVPPALRLPEEVIDWVSKEGIQLTSLESLMQRSYPLIQRLGINRSTREGARRWPD